MWAYLQVLLSLLEATAAPCANRYEIFIDTVKEKGITPEVRQQYNKEISERFERVRDYIVAHYKLNTRQDSVYWKENRENMHLSNR